MHAEKHLTDSCICSHNLKMGVKLKAEYGQVLHMPILKEGKDRVSLPPGSLQSQQSYIQPGEEGPDVANNYTQIMSTLDNLRKEIILCALK